MKHILIITFCGLLFSCKDGSNLKDLMSNHPLELTSTKTNQLKVGDQFQFGHSETMGVDLATYPPTTYSLEYDTNFIQFEKSTSTNDGAAGGNAYYYDVYECIKKGTTNIKRFKTDYIYEDNNKNEMTVKERKMRTELDAEYIVEVK
jgi:phosphodiesterase/alkaline phosphatase D-like protein